MISKELVSQLVSEFVDDKDYYLVDVAISLDNRISVEVDSFNGVSIDFCAELSRFIEAQLDREEEDYELQVSSSGLTSPFKVKKQYEKNLGNEVEVLTKSGEKMSGVLVDVTDERFAIEIEKKVKLEGAKRKTTVLETVDFSYNEIKTTKYIFRFK